MKKSTLMLIMISITLTLTLTLKVFFSSTSIANIRNIPVAYKLPSLAPMLEQVIPSVVSIIIEGNTVVHTPKSSDQSYSFFRKNLCLHNKIFFPVEKTFNRNFLKESIARYDKFRALGSGVIIDASNNYVVTNNHVVNHANKIQVQLSDGRKYQAVVIGKDVRSDIALIQLKGAEKLTAIKIANSDKIKVGDYTIAIGNPYGLGGTVTSGIISAIGRSGLNIEHYENFIQTDAAINRGNSGGALVNLKGELIGINTAILAPDGGNIGIGFAIPSNMVKNLTKQMVNFGQVRRGELGIIGTELNSELAKVMKLNTQKGAFVSQVYPNSAADRSGIKSGDVIIFLNNKPIYSFLSLRAEISSFPINTEIILGILRDGHVKKFVIKLEKILRETIDSSNVDIIIEGAELSNCDINGYKRVLINDVKSNTSAFALGLRKNDIILGLNKMSVSSVEDLRRILSKKPSILVFCIQRGNHVIYLLLQ
ncbi:serine endoprotease [Buchnera aphidicola (Nipponaphis monzeni)]|uniref:Serine endoprotease n=1 Tax=Buchnera aphidicola (Nipponaphis monzeni) TaxID=2495405 RepID=A0A455TA38_9GAMM|nr:Do family serine endopeptidase [Buchnera aphidicola]BBI01193.1 serine endoprotease [Buchnera aphidicola (Nipponaphis monzeni)]